MLAEFSSVSPVTGTLKVAASTMSRAVAGITQHICRHTHTDTDTQTDTETMNIQSIHTTTPYWPWELAHNINNTIHYNTTHTVCRIMCAPPTCTVLNGDVCTGPEEVSANCRPLCRLPHQLQDTAITREVCRQLHLLNKGPESEEKMILKPVGILLEFCRCCVYVCVACVVCVLTLSRLRDARSLVPAEHRLLCHCQPEYSHESLPREEKQ